MRRISLRVNTMAGVGLIFAIMTAGVRPTRAELLVGLNNQNTLVRFDSATPGVVTIIGFVTGLTPGDVLASIDRRPSTGPNNGLIYGLGINSGTGSARLYTLSEANAVATLVSTLTADPADTTAPFPYTGILTAGGVSMDFDPTTERLRVVTDTDQNLRVNVDNGLTQLDVPLAYQPGDSGFGSDAVIIGLAYDNNFGGAPTTTLRGLDVNKGPDRLVIHTNPNGGLLQSSAFLPFDAPNSNTAYDVSGLTGTGYFVISPGGSELYQTGPGGVTFVGPLGSGAQLRGLAAPVGPPVVAGGAAPEPASLALLTLSGPLMMGMVRTVLRCRVR